MELRRLLHARSVAVVGATERHDSYGGLTLQNLAALGYEGDVWGVNPRRDRAHGYPCFPSLSDLPEVPDAVVVAIPAAGVPGVIEEAGELGCGGAVVYGAGFGEVGDGRELEEALVTAAGRHGLPVCGPNGNGIVAFHQRLALWGDALPQRQPGHVALVSQSGNLAVNALAVRHGLGLHTVVSCGNQAVLEAADFVADLAAEDDVRSIALYLEADGDGARLCEALAACADAEVGVAVLKVASSAAGVASAAAHTGAIAGDQRVFRSLIEEAGAAWAADPHELLELGKALALRRRAPRGPGLTVLTCSGGDSSLAADEAERREIPLPQFGRRTAARLAELLPPAATIVNPLDYTSMIWGDAERLRDLIVAVGNDPAVDQVLVLYDQPPKMAPEPAESWAAVLEGILAGARVGETPMLVASTIPELLGERSAEHLVAAGIPAVAGLRTGLACAGALAEPPGDPARLREIAAAAASRASATAVGGRWLAEHDAKGLLRSAGVAVPEGGLAGDEADAAALLARLGAPVAMKLSAPGLNHKSDRGALELDVRDEAHARAAHGRLRSLGEGEILVEHMAPPGAELLVSARRDAVVPALVVALGGVWTEALSDAAVVPLPASSARVERALRSLRGWPLLSGARGRPRLDVGAAARLASAAGEALLAHGLELVELNPVIVGKRGAVAVDALIASPAPERAGVPEALV